MKVILDTNVFVSGVFFSGPPYQILKAWRDGKLRFVISQEIFDEYQRVGDALSAQSPEVDLQPILELVAIEAEMFSAHHLPHPICDDPDDDKFLSCALASKCKVIISGDRHLLKVSGFQKIQVLKPREFIDAHLTEPHDF